MPATGLRVTNVGPFDEIALSFDQQVNVLTGPNNSGKSTLLWVLGELLVFPFTMPTKVLRSDHSLWSLSVSSSAGIDSLDGTLPADTNQLLPIYEKIGYTRYIPAQRQSTNFRSSGPTVFQDVESKLDEFLDLFAQERSDTIRDVGLEAFRQSLRVGMGQNENLEFKRRSNLMLTGNSLVSDTAVKQKIIDLDYASYRRATPAMRAIVNQVASMASKIAEGFPIQFKGVGEDSEGLYPEFRTPDGDLPLDVLSQGTQSIIQFLAHLIFGYAEYYDFPKDLEEKPGILLIDEIDAHLHPTWQRRIIPTLIGHFPNLQIICSTHSPLMLAGLNAGQVKLFRRDKNGKVSVSDNESDIAGWTADEILRQFMGVSNPTDMSTVCRLNRLQELTRLEGLSDTDAEELEQLRHTVSRDLLSGPMSAQVIQFAEELRRARGESTPDESRTVGDREGSRE